MTYAHRRALAIALTITSGTIGLIELSGPTSLGLPPLAANWLGILGGAIGLALGFLPKVTGAGDPVPLQPVDPRPAA